tara:strand:+ start:21809 stop:22267 length:459 start_codon:yes stop_codon:yes gene_type:complete
MDSIKDLIEGIKVIPLTQINDKRGAVFHVLKRTDSHFKKFGEAYFSKINHGVIKGWKFHKRMTQNFSVPFGKLKLVLFDSRQNSKTFGTINEFFLDSKENYNLLQIPPKVWYSFKCISDESCLLLNIADIPHKPEESINEDINSTNIKYKWK